MRRKIISIICIISVSLAVLPMVSCGESDENLGTFYTLQEGYDLGIVDKDDLQTIAYLNNNRNMPKDPDIVYEPFPCGVKDDIIISYMITKQNRNDFDDNTKYDYYLFYYGLYNRCYAVLPSCRVYAESPYTDEWITVEGVEFHYFKNRDDFYYDYIYLWKENV